MEKQSDPTQEKSLAKQQLAKILVNAGLLGVGAGAAYSGSRGLINLFNKPLPTVDAGSQLYDPIHLNRPEGLPSEKQAAGGFGRALAGAASRVAKNMNNVTNSTGSSMLDSVYGRVAKMLPDSFVPMTGENVTKNWPVTALGIPLAVTGLYAGATGLNKLMDSYKKHRKSQELSEAERKYHEAIKQQFQATMMDKSALDTAYDNYRSKQAQDPQYTKNEFLVETLPNLAKSFGVGAVNMGKQLLTGAGEGAKHVFETSPLANQAVGTYGAGLGLMGLLGGHLGYNYNKKRQQQKIMERAILERRRARGLMQPLYAVPGSDEDAE
jgi:hypothetical protein